MAYINYIQVTHLLYILYNPHILMMTVIIFFYACHIVVFPLTHIKQQHLIIFVQTGTSKVKGELSYDKDEENVTITFPSDLEVRNRRYGSNYFLLSMNVTQCLMQCRCSKTLVAMLVENGIQIFYRKSKTFFIGCLLEKRIFLALMFSFPLCIL